MASTILDDGFEPQEDLAFWQIRSLSFRVLILGRANAGKSSILERIAGESMEAAQVYRNGVLLSPNHIRGDIERGEHDINEEIRFRSCPGFVFHDSRGLEAGDSNDLKTLYEFVQGRSTGGKLKTQLHMIW
ncbi:hypothetical protein BT96DRAFT_1006260 [Gymnopus androsaceus JB14]|uniref:G domain-containing protein n=1 Tax=Gymnopus androsaceus JB14 TaxID=1447944 RepID=A0A6A4GKL6_9AGAR|nr:hypothetical protein BT96DRAFT_1006260 [Gymnopus androsaceus JB14]